MKKKILSLILASVMLLGLVPTAFADSGRNQRESFVTIAASQIGYREKFQNGTKYGSWYGLPGQPWCCMFVSWCARYAGVPESVIPNFAGCLTGSNWFKNRGLWRTRDYTPQAGDLMFIDALEDDGTRDGYPDHIAIVERATATTVYTIEGNSIHDMVERRERPRDSSVCGYATPQYGSISSTEGTITLSKVRAPWGELTGEDFGINGVISSNYTLKWVYADIRNLDGDYFSSVQKNPGSKTFDIYTLNGSLDFAQLGPGSYELFIEAVDSSYSYLQKRYSFTVAATDVDFDGKHVYFADGIKWAIGKGISNGSGYTKFKPDAMCTRAEVVTFLWRAAGRPAPESEYCRFSDVSDSSYYALAVQWAAEQGITTGTSAKKFSPNACVTRAQFVTFLWRYLGKSASSIDNPFSDVHQSDYYYNAVLWAYENGVTNGNGGDHFAPKAGATRAQVVTFLYRALEEPLEPVAPVEPTEPTEPTEPVEPTVPVEPTEPTEPTEQPAEPVEPTEPTESTETTETTETTDTTESSEITESTQAA